MASLQTRLGLLATAIANQIRDTRTKWVKLAADTASNSNPNSPSSSGLSFPCEAGATYIVDFVGGFTAAATTTGLGLQLDGPGTPVVAGLMLHHAATTQTLTGHEQVADAATPQSSSGVRAAATLTPVRARWIIETPTAGTVTLQFKTEVNASAVVLKRPSALGYLKI